jgi:hypothetical protein
MPYDPKDKPDPKVCPREFCFMWQLGIPLSAKTPKPASVEEGCGCPAPIICTRLDAARSGRDYYEDHGPNLERAGLPWFYFYPTPLKLAKRVRQEYIAESEALWGERHWEQNPEPPVS